MAAHLSSHGRGGAGNIKSTQSPTLSPSDLETPTLKKPVVTTGRGGTGNMAKNNDPNLTRQRQDVMAVPRRPSSGAQHAGRGGAGNVFTGDEADLMRVPSPDAVDDSSDSFVSKGKQWLFGKKQ
ncbi:hypothetical protein S7711_08201 [Stachybotrys chartarum IBT 7711]|uniref:Uncharacterized protein n=1 Tax=Stachybotrys chartarum (strain CBS 109288 / IBT 7711) TaxID=1280523 RepID=A0A084AI31_STACB|nr:hypothetical protein S7711_08201 [Stachybotrys chartarum IBT 7711]KFA51783.1 hypothetical protein S40293_05864 [Stachybotrys chartarum IBT 40293]KFA79634.1 hypothetical protein S40288_04066 [Stachybotrys chartarum IBT 40288]